jgi:hypothetical protein
MRSDQSDICTLQPHHPLCPFLRAASSFPPARTRQEHDSQSAARDATLYQSQKLAEGDYNLGFGGDEML